MFFRLKPVDTSPICCLVNCSRPFVQVKRRVKTTQAKDHRIVPSKTRRTQTPNNWMNRAANSCSPEHGSKPRVRVIGKTVPDPEVRVPTISFMVDDTRSSDITLAVDKHLIGIRYGHFYAKRLIDDLGLAPRDGVVRVSMVHYNTLEEVDRLIGVLDLLI